MLSTAAEGVTVMTVYELSGPDLRITVKAKDKGGKPETAEIMLVTGQAQWMLTKDVKPEKGFEIDLLDGPVLNLKLVMELLRAAAPGGPNNVKNKASVNIQEQTRPIHVNTASAEGGLEAPWTLQGTIEPAAPGQWSFDLTAVHDQPLHVEGTWQKDAAPAVFPDGMPLDEWEVWKIGPMRTTEGNTTILDYGAQRSHVAAKTLGELRKATAK